jgi:hypothetical protein
MYAERVEATDERPAIDRLSSRVAAEVRAEMARQRLSGARVAKALGWSPMYLSRRVSGQTPFDVDDLEALASLLGVAVMDFFPPGGVLRGGPNNRHYPMLVTHGDHTILENSRIIAA